MMIFGDEHDYEWCNACTDVDGRREKGPNGSNLKKRKTKVRRIDKTINGLFTKKKCTHLVKEVYFRSTGSKV